MAQTEAQEEFQRFVDKNNGGPEEERNLHPEDRIAYRREAASSLEDDLDEEDQYRARQIDAAMRMPGSAVVGGGVVKLPPASFDSGRATGVKGVIADARSYEQARKETFMNKVRHARRSVFGLGGFGGGAGGSSGSGSEAGGERGHGHSYSTSQERKSDLSSSDLEDEDLGDEESFLAQWREARRRELEAGGELRPGASVRTRRTSPSVRIYGRLDTVDALGYLDAIEKVGRETMVVVFVYDEECAVSGAVEAALRPLVGAYPSVHFVKVHYDDIEFDNAAVPAILAYRNQGDLVANLTGLLEMLPGDDETDDDVFSSETLHTLLRTQGVL